MFLKNVSGQKVGAQLVSATDGSAFTGSVTVAVTLDAGTQATGSVGSGACTHEGGGYHTYAPAQAETNGDLCAFTFSGTGAVPVTVSIYPLPATGVLAPATLGRTLVVDASGLADANVVKVGPTGSGTSQTAKDLGAINVTNLNTLSGHDPGATLGTSTLTQTQVTGGAYALNSSSFAFNSAMDLTTTQKASVNSEADTALGDYDGPTYTELLNMVRLILRKDSAIATDLSSLLTAINADLASGGGAFANTTDSQEALRDRGDAAWITATSVAISTAGMQALIELMFTYDATATYGTADAGSLVAQIADNAGGSALTEAGIADAVWEELIAGHSGTSGSTAEALASASSAGDPWNTALPGAYASGKAGYIIGTYLDAAITSRLASASYSAPPSAASIRSEIDSNSTQLAAIVADTNELQTELADGGRTDLLIDAIKAKTDNLPSDPADASDISSSFSSVNSTLSTIAGYIDTEVAAIYSRIGAPAGASIAADIAAVKSETAAIVTDTNELQTDLTNGGRLDLLIDTVVADTTQIKADLPARPTRGVQLDDLLFMMVDATDLNTPETGVTVTATISKDGGSFASCTNSVSEISGGWYKITLTATEMTASSIAVKFTGTGCAQRNIAIRTQPT